ncbi:velvet factor-domain-containing protein [Limtongia smithiae]|uniref:velvet factor-domain-containing protein n=1 Tax=Limtongia smithiae TaxID=1125753 RepID=UPI0034CEEA00
MLPSAPSTPASSVPPAAPAPFPFPLYQEASSVSGATPGSTSPSSSSSASLSPSPPVADFLRPLPVASPPHQLAPLAQYHAQHQQRQHHYADGAQQAYLPLSLHQQHVLPSSAPHMYDNHRSTSLPLHLASGPLPQQQLQHSTPMLQQQQQQQQMLLHPSQQQQQPTSHTLMGASRYDDPSELYTYELKVVQQPVRARMCGFGDKDRRPITPPPCIQLIIKDRATGRDADISKLDVSFFALTVELWSVDETQNLSLVSTLPLSSIAAQQAQNQQYAQYHQSPNMNHAPTTPAFVAPPVKNLIGSVVATAFKLYDPAGNMGIWFILQDLSVRTEGEFKLKASFVNLGSPLTPLLAGDPAASMQHSSTATAARNYSNANKPSSSGPSFGASSSANTPPLMVINTGTARFQATCFSDSFRVYIAKKFPGVIESTELSRCFALQGIKIPIRKDQKKNYDKDNDQQPQAPPPPQQPQQ